MDIVLHTQEGCPKCAVLRQKLSAANIPFVENTDKETMLALGITMTPCLEIGSTLMDFSSALNYIKELKNGNNIAVE